MVALRESHRVLRKPAQPEPEVAPDRKAEGTVRGRWPEPGARPPYPPGENHRPRPPRGPVRQPAQPDRAAPNLDHPHQAVEREHIDEATDDLCVPLERMH